MTPTVWSVAILVGAFAGILAVRTLAPRIRIVFDVACFLALSVALYRRGASPLPIESADAAANIGVWLRVIIVAWWLIGARIVVAALYFTLRQDKRGRAGKLVVDLAAAGIYIGAGIAVLKFVLALPLAGLVATSSVLAIVVGLALQNTLADVFAGIAVGIEAPFQVGDRISLGKDFEGCVIETNWRSIRLRTDSDDIAIVPNSVVAKGEIVNRSVPTRRRAVSVAIRWSTKSDVDRIIECLQHSTMLCPTLLDDPAPRVRLARLGPTWNMYSISFSVADTSLVEDAKSQVQRHARKQLHYARLTARQILQELTLFEGIQPVQLDELAGRLVTRLLEPGEVLFAQDTTDATLYVVASGIVEVSRVTGTAPPVVLGKLGAGEYIGEIGLLTGTPHAATVQARTHCRIYQLSRDDIAPLLATTPDLAAAFEKSIRRGLDLLHRTVAARAAGEQHTRGRLLQRIVRFFGVPAESA